MSACHADIDSEETSMENSDGDDDIDMDDNFLDGTIDLQDMELDGESEPMKEKLATVQEVCNKYCLISTNPYVNLYGYQYLPIS